MGIGSGTYSSSNTSIATVDANGVVTGVSAGVAIITYETGNECSGSATITVYANPIIPDYQTSQADCIDEIGGIVFLNPGDDLYYSIENGDFILYTGEISLGVGTYNFRIKYDEDSCISEEFDITISRPSEVDVDLIAEVTQPDCDILLGTIIITNAGSLGDLNYTVTHLGTGTDYYSEVSYPVGGFIELPVGSYYVSAISDNGCVSGNTIVQLVEPVCVEFEGCTLGYWKNHTDRWCDAYQTCTLYGEVFEDAPDELSDLTLLEVLNLGGGGIYNLGRQSVAALLNACNNNVAYELETTSDVIEYVNANFDNAGPAGSYLDELNNAGCPMGGSRAATAPSEGCDDEVDNGNGNNGSNGNNGKGKEVSASFNAYPVPFRETLNIEYSFDYVSPATIQMFDMQGKLLRSYKEPKAYKGQVTVINIDNRTRTSQMYILRVTTDRDVFVKQIISDK